MHTVHRHACGQNTHRHKTTTAATQETQFPRLLSQAICLLAKDYLCLIFAQTPINALGFLLLSVGKLNLSECPG